jgi:glutathione S-transferase
VTAGLEMMAEELGEKSWCHGEGYSLADIAVGCCLGWLSLRLPDLDWASAHPNLKRLYDKLSKRPSFSDTAPSQT